METTLIGENINYLIPINPLWSAQHSGNDTDNLLIGLDIDFIFSKEDYPKTITVLRDNGYSDVEKYKYVCTIFTKHINKCSQITSILEKKFL